MFNPSREEVRRFFCDAWQKRIAGNILTPLEAIAVVSTDNLVPQDVLDQLMSNPAVKLARSVEIG